MTVTVLVGDAVRFVIIVYSVLTLALLAVAAPRTIRWAGHRLVAAALALFAVAGIAGAWRRLGDPLTWTSVVYAIGTVLAVSGVWSIGRLRLRGQDTPLPPPTQSRR